MPRGMPEVKRSKYLFNVSLSRLSRLEGIIAENHFATYPHKKLSFSLSPQAVSQLERAEEKTTLEV